MYDQFIAPATTAEADRILDFWGAPNARPLESRNAVWPEPLVQIFGDVAMPSREQVVARARRLVRRPDFRHVVRLLDMRGMRTAEVPDDRLDELVENLFVPAQLPWSAGPEAIANAELRRDLAVLPFRMVIGDRYVATRRSHVFGDLYADVHSFPAFLFADDEESAPTPQRSPLLRALAHTLARHPGRVVAALRADRTAPEQHVSDAAPALWQRELCYVTSAPGWLDDLKARLRGEGVSVGGWLTATLHAGLREAGIPTHPGALVVADCRRYLPPRARHLAGNFVAGSFLPLADPTDAVAASAAIRSYTGSARPLLAMAASRRSDRRTGGSGAVRGDGAAAGLPQHRDLLPDSQGRAYVGLSHCPRVPWPTEGGAAPGYAYNVPTPIGPEGVAAITMVSGGRLSVSLGTRAGQYDRGTIRQIAELMTGDAQLTTGTHAVARS